jgi:hypothetical protein
MMDLNILNHTLDLSYLQFCQKNKINLSKQKLQLHKKKIISKKANQKIDS